MTHYHYIPKFPLNQFISSFTYYKNYKPDHSIDRYLPTGNTEIIIDFTSAAKYTYDNQTLLPLHSYKKIWISGIRNSFITIPSGMDAEMFIIEFKKGMVYPFLGKPLTDITEKVVEGDLILEKTFIEMREQLMEQSSVQEMFLFAEKNLLKKFLSRLHVNPFIDFAVSKILLNPGAQSIKSIADKTGYSSKHFIKIFSDNVGITPKSFLKVIRFQKAISEIETTGKINWASLAYDCGYYDQAHFIADFKNFSGLTPLEYTKSKGAILNYIPVG